MTYVTTSEVSTLKHELRDHTVELAVLVAEAGLTSAELQEVFGRLGDDVVEELEVDATGPRCNDRVRSMSRTDDRPTQRTLLALVHAGDLAVGITLSLRTSPGAVEVDLLDHVGGSGVERA